jgi:hypothetical protein
VTHSPPKKVLLIRPAAFGFNPQTAESNYFQNDRAVATEANAPASRALIEFEALAAGLLANGVEALIYEDTPFPEKPDAVFPNHWFSTHADGTICLYPMLTENRRIERRDDIVENLRQRFDVSRVVNISHLENENKFLEGTGSLVLDHENRIAYACLSPRTSIEALNFWTKEMGFDAIVFSAKDLGGNAIYHTNVMMCVGDSFAVVCEDSITDLRERNAVRQSLINAGKEIVAISLPQMEDFAGNMLLLQNPADEKLLVMSRRAFDSLETAQISQLEKHARRLLFDVSTIEKYGGGSIRCMIAEIFLPEKRNSVVR